MSAKFSIRRQEDFTTLMFITRMFCLDTDLTLVRMASRSALACLSCIYSVNWRARYALKSSMPLFLL